jgi:hypothetical protein
MREGHGGQDLPDVEAGGGMKEYLFENQLNSNIEIRIKAYNFTDAMELLLATTRDIDDYKLKEQAGCTATFKYVYPEVVNDGGISKIIYTDKENLTAR